MKPKNRARASKIHPFVFVAVPLAVYLILASRQIDSPFIHMSEDDNGVFGVSAKNLLRMGILRLKFGVYWDWIHDPNEISAERFYTHHPSLFLLPNVVVYRIFGVSERTTRLPGLLVVCIALIPFYLALLKLFETPRFGFLTVLIFSILPGSVYYGKLFDMLPYTIAMSLATYSFFTLYYLEQRRAYWYSFWLGVFLGGLTSWFYYFMPAGVFLFLFTRYGRLCPARQKFLTGLPVVVVATFLANLIHFYVLKGASALTDLRESFFIRITALPLASWLDRLLWIAKLNFNSLFLITASLGLAWYLWSLRKEKKFALLLPIILMPSFNVLLFRQWSTHPFGLVFFLPVVALATAMLLDKLISKRGSLRMIVALLIVTVGFYLSWEKLELMYNQYLILGPKDIELLKEIKPQVGDDDVCIGQNQVTLNYSNIFEWYLQKKTQLAPQCFSAHPRAGLIFHPNLGNFYEEEKRAFEQQGFHLVGCGDDLCVMSK